MLLGARNSRTVDSCCLSYQSAASGLLACLLLGHACQGYCHKSSRCVIVLPSSIGPQLLLRIARLLRLLPLGTCDNTDPSDPWLQSLEMNWILAGYVLIYKVRSSEYLSPSLNDHRSLLLVAREPLFCLKSSVSVRDGTYCSFFF